MIGPHRDFVVRAPVIAAAHLFDQYSVNNSSHIDAAVQVFGFMERTIRFRA